ncbi:MAG: hypothetical protein KGL42_09965 [Betaproteobacteria bacterium]|nr:hypothetical protein [Betaproteobacteria bacterium]
MHPLKAAARRHLNQVNPELGLEYPLSHDIGLAAGFYRNSLERISAYALGEAAIAARAVAAM